jgi:hypothetical protein
MRRTLLRPATKTMSEKRPQAVFLIKPGAALTRGAAIHRPIMASVERYPKLDVATKLLSQLSAAIALCCNGCASMCPYVETGQLVSAEKGNAPPLADVVGRAIKPFGFFSELPNNPTTDYPTGNSTTRDPTSSSNSPPVSGRGYIDFNHVELAGFSDKHPVVVSIDPVERRIYITDFASSAASDPFVKTVRDAIRQEVVSVYGQQIDIQPPRSGRGAWTRCL